MSFSRRKLKFLSETCKTGSITFIKVRLAGYEFRRFFGLKSVSRLALRQRRRRRRRRTCLWELSGVLCYSSTLFVFLVTLLKFLKNHELNSPLLFLSLSPRSPLSLSLSGYIWAAEGSVDDSVVRLYVSL